jgi:hypothetical protein
VITEQKLIDTNGALMDEYAQTGEEWTSTSIARRAIERLGGDGVVPLEAVADLAGQVFTARFKPWIALPGTTPRLRKWCEGVVRLEAKPSAVEILHAELEAGESLEVALARANPTRDEFDAYEAWWNKRLESQKAQARELDRVRAICQPVWDEDPDVPIDEALRIMASRGKG